MLLQSRSTRVKTPVISDPDNVPVEALSSNEKATLTLLGMFVLMDHWKAQ